MRRAAVHVTRAHAGTPCPCADQPGMSPHVAKYWLSWVAGGHRYGRATCGRVVDEVMDVILPEDAPSAAPAAQPEPAAPENV